MGKVDVIYKIAVVLLLGLIAYQQNNIQVLLRSVEEQTQSVNFHLMGSTMSVKIAGGDKPLPVEIKAPLSFYMSFGQKMDAIPVVVEK